MTTSSEIDKTLNDMTDRITRDLVKSWTDGLCDGLEYAARTAEIMLDRYTPGSPGREALLSLAVAIRQAEMSLLLKDLGEKNGPDTTSSVA